MKLQEKTLTSMPITKNITVQLYPQKLAATAVRKGL
jgi:hypothetical protein